MSTQVELAPERLLAINSACLYPSSKLNNSMRVIVPPGVHGVQPADSVATVEAFIVVEGLDGSDLESHRRSVLGAKMLTPRNETVPQPGLISTSLCQVRPSSLSRVAC